MIKDKFGFVLNIIITILLIMIIFYIINPIFYGKSTKGKNLKDSSKVGIIKNAIDIYTDSYVKRDYKKIKSIIPFIKLKNDKNFMNVSEKYDSLYIDELTQFQINDIKQVNKNTFIVSYFLKSGYVDIGILENKVIINLNERKGTFKIYYDELLNS